MLLEFSVVNFRSIQDRVTLSLLADEKEQDHPENTFAAPDGNTLLRTAAVYGANASGKSNLFKAMSFVRAFVLGSFRDAQAGEPIAIERFRLNPTAELQPSEFEVVFFHSGTRYRYGFTVNDRHVLKEWLFHRSGCAEAQLFLRSAAEDSSIQVAPAFGSTPPFPTRENALFLSTAAQHSREKDRAGQLVSWFRDLRIMSGLSKAGDENRALLHLTEPKYKALVLAMLIEADMTVADLDVKRRERGPAECFDVPREVLEVTTKRQAFADSNQPAGLVPFLWDEESEGTRKFIALSAPFVEALIFNHILFVDDLDAQLHPLLTSAILELFQRRKKGSCAQLVFAAHDIILLDRRLMRRDQVWFIEKDTRARTALYSLAEYDVSEKEDPQAGVH